jgi:hypothetical protein
MAATLAGSRLTQAHTAAQIALQRRVQSDLLILWQLLDPADIDGTFPRFFQAASALLAARRSESAGTAAAYYRAFREAEGVNGRLSVVLMDHLATEQAMASLTVTGPVAYKVARRGGALPEQAMNKALVQTLGAGSRLVAQGGRETVLQTVQHDPQAYGVARVTRGGSCSFCAMLASRGPVYKDATGSFRAHDHCHCGTEIVFDHETYQWPGGQAQHALSALWADTTKGLSGADAENAFRRAYERPALHA